MLMENTQRREKYAKSEVEHFAHGKVCQGKTKNVRKIDNSSTEDWDSDGCTFEGELTG